MNRRTHESGDHGRDSYQIDVVVSLFAVMLVVLVVLTAATAVSENDTDTRYRVQDPPVAPVALRSIQVPYRLRQHWVLGPDGFLGRIDRGKVIAAFEDIRLGDNAATTIGRETDLSMILDKTELGSFQMKWRFANPDDAAGILAERLDWRDEAALAEWASRAGGVVVFAHRAAHLALPTVDAALRNGGRGHDFVMLRNPLSYMVFARYRSNFSGTAILRAH